METRRSQSPARLRAAAPTKSPAKKTDWRAVAPVREAALLYAVLACAHCQDWFSTREHGGDNNAHMGIVASMVVGSALAAWHAASGSRSQSHVDLVCGFVAALPAIVAATLWLTGMRVPVVDTVALGRLMGSWVLVLCAFEFSFVLGDSEKRQHRLLFFAGHAALIPLVQAPVGVSNTTKAVGFGIALLAGAVTPTAIVWLSASLGPWCRARMARRSYEQQLLHTTRLLQDRNLELEKQLATKDAQLEEARGQLVEIRSTCNEAVNAYADVLERVGGGGDGSDVDSDFDGSSADGDADGAAEQAPDGAA